MANHQRAIQLERINHASHDVGLDRQRGRRTRMTHRIAATRPINSHHMVVLGQLPHHAVAEILRYAAKAVDHQNGRASALLQIMHARALNLQKSALRRHAQFNTFADKQRIQKKPCNDKQQENTDNTEQITHDKILVPEPGISCYGQRCPAASASS